jgi:hypothetical protein
VTGAELLAMIKSRGGRVHRYRAIRVCCLTTDEGLARELLAMGARLFRTASGPNPYRRGDKLEWDLELQQVEVEGPTVWEAAGERLRLVKGGAS